jgi:hypothetical protein
LKTRKGDSQNRSRPYSSQERILRRTRPISDEKLEADVEAVLGGILRSRRAREPLIAQRERQDIAKGRATEEGARPFKIRTEPGSSHPAMKLKLNAPESNHARLFRFLERDLPAGSDSRRRFDDLCHEGCEPAVLFSHLQILISSACSQKMSIYDLTKLSRSQLVKLSGELEQVAERIEQIRPLMRMFWPPESQERLAQDTFYKNLVGLLRVVAANLRDTFDWLHKRVGPKRYDSFRGQLRDLLKYVTDHTGGARCADLCVILDYLWKEDFTQIPALLDSPEALRQFYSRLEEYGFRSPKHQSL